MDKTNARLENFAKVNSPELEGRELEEQMISDSDPYIGTKLPIIDEQAKKTTLNADNAWNSLVKLFEHRNNQNTQATFCSELHKYYEHNPEDVEFYLPQLWYFLGVYLLF